ncbi:uncharacterized protein ACMZJ9_019109 [Mantella aurantiaca]
MGNSSSTKGLWPPGKLFQRKPKQNSTKKRSSSRTNSRNPPPVGPMYDTVADDIPVYSVVDKSRQNNIKVEDNVQYAEIEVIRKPAKRSQKKPALLPKPVETTEYATINFPPQHTSADQYEVPPQHTSAKQYEVPPQHTSAKQYKAPPKHTSPSRGHTASESQSPWNYNSTNGTLV